MTITNGSGTYASMVGTYSGPGWNESPATTGQLFDQGAIFAQVNIQPTGTGVIDSFLRLQNSPTEQGYNTDARSYNSGGNLASNGVKTQFDEKSDLTFTHALQLGEVPIVTINKVKYREFFLDINENAASPGNFISLDQLEIYLSASPTLDKYTTGAGGTPSSLTGSNGGSSSLIYSLDTGFGTGATPDNPFVDNFVQLDYLTSSGGSGKGDMVFYLPDSLFTVGGNPYVYLYSQFGCGGLNTNCNTTKNNKYTSDDSSNAGFEEWWVRSIISQSTPPPPAVPEPTTLVLLGTGLIVASRSIRKRIKNGE
jgi:hypothetical protein